MGFVAPLISYPRTRTPLGGRLCLAHCFLSRTLSCDFAARHSRLDSRIELATIGGQVGVSVGCHEKQSSGLSAIIPVLQLPRLACEAVKVITDNRIEELGLKVGETAYAVIKASNVMVGADH